MSKLTCAIIDDDAMSLAVVEKLALKCGMLEVSGKFQSAEEALPYLLDKPVQLLFLDVEMPGMNGLEMMKSLPLKPEVIVVSGKPEYAVAAFDLSVTDYLVKPVVDYSRFLTAVNKVVVKQKLSFDTHEADASLFVKVDSLLTKLNTESILYVEAFGDYIKICTTDKIFTIYSTLKNIEDKLDKKKFVRVHRSYLVNINKITNVDPTNLEISKKIVPISASYKEELLKRIQIL